MVFSFGKKKARKAAEAAAEEEKARLEAARAAVAKAEAEKKSQEVEARQREDRLVNDISAKRKEIDQLVGAIDGFHKRLQMAVRNLQAAKKANKKAEAAVHLRSAKALEKRIKDYEIRIGRAQDQLTTLEDTASLRHAHDSNKHFTESVKHGQLDKDEVENVLQDMRETMDKTNDVNLAIHADHNLHGTTIDDADMDDEIGRLAAEYGVEDIEEKATTKIPSVPGTIPVMPGAASATAAEDKEEEEIRRLEESMGMA